jgi:hypothetical protein
VEAGLAAVELEAWLVLEGPVVVVELEPPAPVVDEGPMVELDPALVVDEPVVTELGPALVVDEGVAVVVVELEA